MQTATQQSNVVDVVDRDKRQVPAAYEEPTSISDMVLDGSSMERMMKVAEMMSKATLTIPKEYVGKPGDCLAIIMQSMQWKMNPFAVAQKTHFVSGKIGYEAQLVNAVIQSMAPTKDRLHFEWFGSWEKILGKFREVESKSKKDDNGHPVKYRMPAWDISAEDGLGVKVWATLKGEDEPRVLTLLMTQARTRNSTLWADDPRQQLAYLATKRWARLYTPDVILGVYTPDEIENAGVERDITGEGEVLSGAGHATAKDALRGAATKGQPEKMTLAKVKEAIAKAVTPEEMSAAGNLALELSTEQDKVAARDAYKARVAELRAAHQAAQEQQKPAEQQQQDSQPAGDAQDEALREVEGAGQQSGGKPEFTYAQVEEKMRKANTEDELAEAADLIQYVPGATLQGDLGGVFKRRREEIRKG